MNGEIFDYIAGPALTDVPADAEYVGPGPLYTWSPDMQAWTTWPLSEQVYWRTEMPKTQNPIVENARAETGWEAARALQIERSALQDRITALLKHAGARGVCKGCKAQVWWVRGAETKTPVPFDPDGRNHQAHCVDASEFSHGSRSFELT